MSDKNVVIEWYAANRPGLLQTVQKAQYNLYPIIQDSEGAYWKVMYCIDSLDSVMLTRLDNEGVVAIFKLSTGEPNSEGDASPNLERLVSFEEAKTLRVKYPPTGEVLMEDT